MKISTSQIDAFLALVETRQFTKAAERCHVSTSAFSQIISRLESSVGVRLFDRSTRHVDLTAEGAVFAVGARRIAAEVAVAASELQSRIIGKVGQVSIAATPTPCVSWLPQVLFDFSQKNPGVALRLRDVTSELCFDLLNDGAVDFAITAREGDAPDLESQPLFDVEFSLVCKRDDPLTARKTVRLKDMAGRNFVAVDGRGDVWERRKADLRDAGVRESGFVVTNFGTLVGLISAGFGIGVVPRLALPLCRRADLLDRPIADKGFVRRFYLVQRSGRTLSVAASRLVDDMFRAVPGKKRV